MNQPDSIQKFFESNNRKRKFPKNSIVIMHGGSLDEVFFINEGIIRVFNYDNRGEQRTITFVSKNHIFPFAWLQFELPKSGALFYYQALTDVVCYAASMESLRNFVHGNSEITWRLLDILSKSYYNAAARIERLQKSNVAEKVDFILYYLAMSFGSSQKEDAYVIDALITRKEIADLAGLTRETVSNQMKKPKYKDIFLKKGKTTLINVSKLDVHSMPTVYRVSTPD